MTILVEGGDATHGMPRRLLVVVTIAVVMNHVKGLAHGFRIPEGFQGLLLLTREDTLDILIDGLLELWLAQRTGIGEGTLLQVRAPDEHLTVLQQIGELLLIDVDGIIGLADLDVMVHLLEIHRALGGDVS